MATDRHEYKVDLNLQTSEASKRSLAALRDSVGETAGNLDDLATAYARLQAAAASQKDAIKLEQQLADVVGEEIDARDKQLAQLDAERVAILTNVELTVEERDAALAINDANVRRLKHEKAHLKARAAEIKLQGKIAKVTGQVYDTNSREYKLAVAKLKLQEKLNTLLAKEGKLRTGIRKAAGAVARGAGAVGGLASSAISGAFAAAGNIYEREAALKSLKRPAMPEDVHDVFVNAGGRADYSQIIDSINKLSHRFSGAELRAHALLDVENPGWAETLLRANRIGATAEEARRVLDQIKRNTGARDLSAMMESAATARSVTTGRISQTDYIQAHAALQGLGFDDERIKHIINSIAAQQGNFIENFNKTDFAKYAWRAQQKTMIRNAGVSIGALSTGEDIETPEQKAARDEMRLTAEYQLKKDQWLAKILTKVMESDLVGKLVDLAEKVIHTGLVDKVIDFAEKGLVALTEIVKYLTGSSLEEMGEDFTEFVKKVPGLAALANAGEAAGALAAGNVGEAALAAARALNPFQGIANLADSLAHKAQGGLVSTPSICGEAGSELVLPLNNPGRAANIVNNYTNTNNFALSGPQTALSLSSAIDNRRFIRKASKF